MKYLIADYELEGFEKSNLSELKKWIKDKKHVALDTETKRYGNSPLKFDIHDTQLVSIQIGTKWDQWFIDASCIEDLSFLDKKIVILHNAKYDYQVLKLEKDYELKRVYDTMLGEYVLNTGLSREKGFYSLEETYFRYFGENPYGNQLSLFDPWIPKSTRSNIEEVTKELAFYGCTDIITTYKVWEAQSIKIVEEKLERVAKLENKFVLVLGDMEINGMPIDVDRWLELDEWAGARLEEAELKLRELYPEVENWNSSKQVGVLFKKIGIPIKNKEGKDSVQELNIKEHAEKFPIIKYYLTYKQFSKLKSTYGIKFLKYVNPLTQRVHSSYMQIMSTGRISATNPNTTNIVNKSDDFPEGIEWRKAFTPDKGRVLVIADYSGQEIMVTASKSGDKNMLEALLTGADLHRQSATALYNKPEADITPEERKEAKILSFSVIYGAGETKVAQQFKVSRIRAKEIINSYFKKYPGIKKYQDKTYETALKTGYILCDKLGRKRYLDNFQEYQYTKSKKLAAEYFRLCANTPIQSEAAAMAKYAGILLRTNLVGTSGKLILLEHDCWIVECDKHESEKIKNIVERCMSTAAKFFCPTVPPPAEAIISNCWNK